MSAGSFCYCPAHQKAMIMGVLAVQRTNDTADTGGAEVGGALSWGP